MYPELQNTRSILDVTAINVDPLKKLLTQVCISVLVLASGLVHAQWSSELSADLPDTRTMAVQDKVDKLFDAGNFKRAFFIYRNELAPLGDKYAQYMVGYMYQAGIGVNEDRIVASAWYRLAAERGTPEFVAVRDQMLRNFDDHEIRFSDARYKALRTEYSDLSVLLTSIKRDLKELEDRTGSRIQSSSSAMTVIETGRGTMRSGADYYGQLRGQLEHRVKLLVALGKFKNVETDIEKINIRELEKLVRERLESDS